MKSWIARILSILFIAFVSSEVGRDRQLSAQSDQHSGDDMGSGDVSVFNEKADFETSNLDQLAENEAKA